MKLIPTLLLLSVSMLSSSALADDAAAPLSVVREDAAPAERRTILGISVLPLQWGEVQLEGERVLSERVSVGLGIRAGVRRTRSESSAIDPGGFDTESTDTQYLVGVSPQVRVFLTGRAPEGFWLSPRLEFAREWSKYESGFATAPGGLESRQWSVGGAALVGYSAVVMRGLTVQAGVGVETAYTSGRQTSSNVVLTEQGLEAVEARSKSSGWSFGERMALSVGWAF